MLLLKRHRISRFLYQTYGVGNLNSVGNSKSPRGLHTVTMTAMLLFKIVPWFLLSVVNLGPIAAFLVPSSRQTGLTRVHASVITSTRRARRRDLTTAPPVQEEDGGDEDDGGGGGGKRWIRVWPIGIGQYGDNTACFLARMREVEDQGSVFEAVPLPLFDAGAIDMVTAAFQRRDQDVSKPVMQWACRHMAVGRGREEGAFDNLPWAAWTGDETGKREAFMKFMGKGVEEVLCPYGVLVRIIEQDLGGSVIDVLLDEEDSRRGPGITFGPVLLVLESPLLKTSPDWKQRTAVVDCTLDEVVGVSLALDRPVAIPEDLFEGTVVQTRSVGRKGGIIQLEAEVDKENAKRVRDLMAKMDAVKPAWDIKTASEFWSLDSQGKRLTLIKSGAKNIPKRRYGEQELELALLPFLDETVRYEARLALAMEAGDEKAVERLVKSKSERSRVKESIAAALRNGDLQTAQELQDRLQLLTEARYDFTQDEGAYQKDMDADEWYLRSRRT